MKRSIMFFMIAFILFSFFTIFANARPEYAAQHGLVSCTLCHQNPVGGGIRKLQGKAYGSHGYEQADLSKQDFWQFDARAEFASKHNNQQDSRGFLVMTNNVGLNAPVLKDPETHVDRLNMVVDYGTGLLSSGLLSAYGIYQVDTDTLHRPLSSVMVGRFYTPFGLATDEHRTYTRRMSKTSMNDFEAGALFSGDPWTRLHYDLALTNGVGQDGAKLATNDNPWGLIANLRMNPFAEPMFVGLSYAVHNMDTHYALQMASLYFVFSTDKWTGGALKGSFSGEVVSTQGWNNSAYNSYVNTDFINDKAWQAALVDSRAIGFNLLWQIQLSEKWQLQIKQEQFQPDSSYAGDIFNRTGVGIKHFLRSNLDYTFRLENSYSTRAGMNDAANVNGVGKMAFLLFHLWI